MLCESSTLSAEGFDPEMIEKLSALKKKLVTADKSYKGYYAFLL